MALLSMACPPPISSLPKKRFGKGTSKNSPKEKHRKTEFFAKFFTEPSTAPAPPEPLKSHIFLSKFFDLATFFDFHLSIQ
jgi:hypothetical protein